jgi:hypothetical protein
MIKPTIGRVVWYRPSQDGPEPTHSDQLLAAGVSRRRIQLSGYRAI